MTANGERFVLELPSDPAYVGTARIFASTLARQFEIPDEVIEDLKLAVSEACARALAEDEHRRLALRVERRDARLVFEIDQTHLGPGPDPTTTPTPSAQELARGLSLELVSALFEDAEVAETGDRPVLRFSVGS